MQEGDCWICMELMDCSLDKFYKFIYEELNEYIPEAIIGKITLATVKALNYLKVGFPAKWLGIRIRIRRGLMFLYASLPEKPFIVKQKW